MLVSVAKVVIKNEEWRMMNEELRMNNGEKQEQQKTIINYKQRAVNKLCHSLTSAVHRSLFYLQFAIYHILFIIQMCIRDSSAAGYCRSFGLHVFRGYYDEYFQSEDVYKRQA